MLREPIGSLLDFASNDVRSVSIVGNMYINRRVGLAFARPPGWLFEDATSLLERAEGRILDPNDEIVTRVIRDLTEEYLPVVTIAAPPLEEGIDRINDVEFRPVVAVHHEPNCEPNLPGGFSLPRHVDIDLDHFVEFMHGFELLLPPKPVAVSGRDAVEYWATYPYLHAQLPDPIPVRERTIYIERYPTLYEVRMCDFPEVDNRLAFDFDDFVASISIA